MGFEKFRRVVGGPQPCARAVALLATERQFDLAVAHQAIRHLRHVRAAHGIGGIDPTVAGQACIRAVQVLAKIARRRQVLSRVDGPRDERRNVAELQVLFVVEMHGACLRRRPNRHALMTRPAHRGRRQVVILHPSAMRDRAMAARAIRLQFQVNAVRERRRAGAGTQYPCENRNTDFELQFAL